MNYQGKCFVCIWVRQNLRCGDTGLSKSSYIYL
uniref:Uncharacterized protein n=1 Tax=Anguilla anguilla TaxID=7936 RepID=A0A0E9PXN0_ANGAN